MPAELEADFEAYVADRWTPLVRFATLLTRSEPDAEDLVQAALVKAASRWERLADHPEPYVRTVIAREHVSRWRRHRGRVVAHAEIPEPPPDTGRADTADVLALRQALADLTPRQRTAVVLRHHLGLSERETAETMRCSVGAVKSQTHAGLRRLRAQLSQDDASSMRAV
ncbi:SigE family RNA polymerase sigma factor [Nocardioidaceae bacterium]|nr:SigE family RNA polymerase sigma factor [Nocardioidaceae bacterium]